MNRLRTTRTLAALLSLAGVALVAAVSRERPRDPVAVAAPGYAIGALHPRLSPDGSAIAFSYQGALWTMPAAGGSARRLTTDAGVDCEPVWSPDGNRLAYVNSPAMGPGELRVIDATTGKRVALSTPVRVAGTALYTKLEYHPDNRRLLGVFAHPDGPSLAFVEIPSGNLTLLKKLSPFSRYALSRDGETIALTATRDVDGQQMGNDGPQAELWTVSSAGGEPVLRRQFPSRIHDLCWSSDHQSLIAASDAGGAHNDLWLVPLNSELPPRRLTSGQGDEDRPSMSGDGQWLLATDNRTGPTALTLRHLATGVEQTVPIEALDFGVPRGKLRLTITDSDTNLPATARVSLQDSPGKFHAPPGSLHRLLGDLSHFYCAHTAEWSLPAGDYKLRVFHGPEYRALSRNVRITAGGTTVEDVALERWTNQPQRGWFSGENHIHANYGYGEWYCTPETMLEQCAGEDLHICNFMVANSDTDGIFDREFFRGGPDPVSRSNTILSWNQEFRSTIWGHMTLVNLTRLVEPIMTGFRETTNPWDVPTNGEIADRAHWQGAVVNYTHVAYNPEDPYLGAYAAKGIPVDVALGKVDTLDLNASYAGTVPLWYRFLNCGFRIPASAGTDTFLNRVRSRLPGGDRVYVQHDGGVNYSRWIEGLKAGRSFVTNGPMLEFSADGVGIGGRVSKGTPGEVRVVARVTSLFPLEKFEIIRDGQVIATGRLNDARNEGSFDGPVRIDQGGWLAVRASGGGHPDLPTGGLFAHSSPIYVEVDGHPQLSREDSRFFLSWLERLSVEVRVRDRVPSAAHRRQIEETLEAAREVYLRKSAP